MKTRRLAAGLRPDAMSDPADLGTEHEAIAAEQVRAYMGEVNVQNVVGALVLSLLVYLAHEIVPRWTWAPGLFGLYGITAVRVVWVWLYHRAPFSAAPARWTLRQTVGSGIAGICWGGTSAAMLPYLPTELQLLVFTVIAVVSAVASSGGFTLPAPARAFILSCLAPPTIWLMIQGDRLHVVLALMLMIFMPMTIWQSARRNRVFVEAQRLRFRNEFLARELAAQHDDLDLAKRRAEDAARAKSSFLANMSHEIRTPLNGVLGMAQIGYRDSAGHDKLHETFGRIMDSGKLLLGIINDILDFSKIDAGKLAIETIPFDPGRVLDDAAEMMRERARSKDIALLTDKSGLPATCHGDPLRLGQVLMNLLSNAVKFTERGSVAVTTSQEGDCLVFRIADTGIGMSPAQVESLFQPFTQGDSSTTRRFGGTGLGLAITARLVELMHGAIRVYSEPDRGSTFEVSLPFAAAPAAEPKPEPQAPPPPRQGLADGRPPIDWAELEAQYGKTPGFVGKMLDMFIENYAALAADIRKAIDARDAERLIELAHGLRSAAGLLMAKDLKAQAEAVESAARNDDPQCFVPARGLIEHLDATLDAVRARQAASARANAVPTD